MKSLVGQAGMKVDSPRKTQTVKLLRLIALVFALIPAVAPKAQAITFNFNYAPSTSPDVVQGFNDAASLWSSLIDDDVTINVDVGFSPVASGSLGQFNPSRINVDYQTFSEALWSDVKSIDDAIASSNLPSGSRFDLLVDSEFDLLINGTRNNPSSVGSLDAYLDNDGDCNNRAVRLTTANAKALKLPTTTTTNCSPGGVTTAQPSVSDGTIILNNAFDWDYDANDGIAPGTFDFVGIATQGLGTLLGFISGVDVLDFNSPQVQNDGSTVYFNDDQFPFVSPIDLFRFSPDSCDASLRAVDRNTGEQQNIIDWTTGRTDELGHEVRKFFSIDGCQTEIAEFSTGLRNGDGQRAGSWKADELTGQYLGIMEPSPSEGQLFELTRNDQRAFDVIGWDLVDPSLPPPMRNIEIENPDDGGSDDGGSDDGGSNDGGSGGSDNPSVSVPEPSALSGLVAMASAGAVVAIAKRKRLSEK
ncbi:MAG TPA: NF038122 family metalloprotease [Elainellaceae cyanobacterium]